jgi:uncharacterized protein YnzC (UPF0291/DUF896 family)
MKTITPAQRNLMKTYATVVKSAYRATVTEIRIVDDLSDIDWLQKTG